MSFDQMLIHLADIVSYTAGQSATGAATKAASGTVSDVACRFMSPVSGRGQFEPSPDIGQTVQTDKELIAPKTATITTEHRVENIRLRSDASLIDSDSYEVVEVSPRYGGGKLHHYYCRLKKIK